MPGKVRRGYSTQSNRTRSDPAKHRHRTELREEFSLEMGLVGPVTGLALALVVGGALWRAHLQNAITYETVPVERGSIQAKVTATSNLNAVVDVLVSSQVSGNIKALYGDWNSKVKKG